MVRHKFFWSMNMHNAYYSLIDEALNNHSRRCRYVGVEAPILGDDLPTRIKKVIVSVTDLLFVPTSQERKHRDDAHPSAGWWHPRRMGMRPCYPLPRISKRAKRHPSFPVLVWDIGQLLGYQAKFEVPTCCFPATSSCNIRKTHPKKASKKKS